MKKLKTGSNSCFDRRPPYSREEKDENRDDQSHGLSIAVHGLLCLRVH
ncbi:MAG: hypothetical protein U9Q66_04485 [Patescibacteria group bacterium]|nr:hypothetical protein [Patescibacteria group bacterium]